MLKHAKSQVLAGVVLAGLAGLFVARFPGVAAPVVGIGLVALAVIPIRRIGPSTSVVLCVVAAVVGEQLTIVVGGTGGSGVLTSTSLLAIYAGVLAFKRGVRSRVWTMLRAKGLPIGAWLALGVLLPVLGVLVGYPARTMAAVLVPLGLAGALIVGASASLQGIDVGYTVRRVLIPLTWLAAFVSLTQFLFYRGLAIPGAEILVQHLRAGAEHAGHTLLYGRASGPYFNPNTLSALGGMGLLMAVDARNASTRSRVLLAIPALILILVGQSRAAILAVFLGVLAYVLWGVASGATGLGRRGAAVGVVVVAGGLTWLGLTQWAPTVVTSLSGRVGSLWSVLGQGASADSSVSGRLGYWAAALAIALARPLGTLGPPQMVTLQSIDSEYVQVLVQGGLAYLGLMIWLLVRALVVSVRSDGALSVSMVTFMVVMGFSGSIMGIAPTLVFWVLLGSALMDPVRGRAPIEDDERGTRERGVAG